ncbi:MAG: hypothetical protein AB7V22_06240 [Kiritimatiellia bacterium]
MDLKLKTTAAVLVLALLATPGFGVPTIVHDPIKMAEKGQPLGVRATVRDAAAPIESVALFYASSRGMTPFRAAMTSSGAGTWYASIPGHMMGPGAQMFYYVQAENADGETRETDWQTVKLVDSGVAPEAIPAASAVAQQARQRATPVAPPAPAAAPAKTGKSKYLLPAAIIVGGGLAIGGALAIATYDSGGGGGGGNSTGVDGNYGGNYDVCFVPGADTNGTSLATVCDDGLVNVYVTNGTARIVGLWGAETLSGAVNGSLFSIVANVGATAEFPAAHLIAAGEISGAACTVRIDGYSTDATRPGDFNGQVETTKR